MDIKGFFTNFFDGTYLRRLLGIKFYDEIDNVTGFDRRTGQMAEGVVQFKVALQNLDLALRNRGLTKDAVAKVTINMVTDNDVYNVENWEIMKGMWLEYFGRGVYDIDPNDPEGQRRPICAIVSTPLIPGVDLIPGATCWMTLTVKAETN
jgi:enamine deaminase RidA (YjgF/YER057c/UK114 family)